MCGITGFVSKEKDKENTIKKMADRIAHRGPDGEGYYTDEFVALGHRRLSIIDLSDGTQPMFNEDKSLVIVFNGEIYNYKDLQKELKKEGHKFKTNCDTEVLIHGYETWDNDLPTHLRGMFSFAIWDIKNKKLFCARDYFGIKPFYYYQKGDVFMFSSEIKSFFEHKDFQASFNRELLAPFLTFSFTPTTETFFEGVYRLDAGCYLEYSPGEKVEITRYFTPEFKETDETYDEAVDKIDEIMHDSVERHLTSDVEVGSFLSSGIDSSYIASLAKPDKTYTVGYETDTYNEVYYAKDLADKLKINNTHKKIKMEEYMEIAPKIMYYMDEPISDPSAISLYFVANLASKDVKVSLSGEGADEFFGGYNSYKEIFDLGWYNKIPYPLRHIVAKILELTPEFRGRNFLVRRGYRLEDVYVGVDRIFSDKECRKVLAFKSKIKNKDITKEVFQRTKDKNDLIKMQSVDIEYWLVKDILHKADRMSMMNSLEVRVPFVDIEVFKLASSLSTDKKVTKTNTKVALRDAAKKVIPNESYKKRKLGFPVPLKLWLHHDAFYKEIENTFDKDFAGELIDQKFAKKLLIAARNGKAVNCKKVWALYSFLKWYEIYFIKNGTIQDATLTNSEPVKNS